MKKSRLWYIIKRPTSLLRGVPMKITADFHTHTRYSHGTGSVVDNTVNALSLGMRAVAITDHAKNHPIVGVKPDKIDDLVKDVKAADKEYRKIRVLSGLEANIISPRGEIDVTEEQAEKLDILLVGFHLTAYQKKFTDYFGLPFNGLLHIFCKNSAKRIAYNTDATIKCVLENKVDILTHPGFRLDVDCAAIAAACAETGTYMELSSRHRIPNLKDLEASLKAGAKFVINSDAHKPVNVGKCDYAIILAEELGLTDNEIVNISDKPVVFRRGLTV